VGMIVIERGVDFLVQFANLRGTVSVFQFERGTGL
jgi:hypothetical protein